MQAAEFLESLVNLPRTIVASLCLVGTQPALAEMFGFSVAAPADQLASCMYQRLRDEHPGQISMVDLTPSGTKEISRGMNGNGWHVFYWRAVITRSTARTAKVEADVSKPAFGPDHAEEIRRFAMACGG